MTPPDAGFSFAAADHPPAVTGQLAPIWRCETCCGWIPRNGGPAPICPWSKTVFAGAEGLGKPDHFGHRPRMTAAVRREP